MYRADEPSCADPGCLCANDFSLAIIASYSNLYPLELNYATTRRYNIKIVDGRVCGWLRSVTWDLI
jgi:hypothetical protein